MSVATRGSLDYGMLETSIDRFSTGLFRVPIEWDQVLRFLLAVVVALGVAYGIGFTGGVITVIAVLMMNVLPHSPRLALFRAVSGIVGFGSGWLLAYQFVDQPWLLLAILFSNAFVWFYLLAMGFPFLTMLVLGLGPVLVAWMVYAGKPMGEVATTIAEYLCGVFGAEVVALTWQNSGSKLLKKSAAAALREFSAQIRSIYGVDRPARTEAGETVWKPSQSLGFNSLLMRCQTEIGSKRAREYQHLVGLVENVRHIVAFPTMYALFVRRGHFDKWMVDMMKERDALHIEIYKVMDAVAAAIEGGYPAEDQPGIEAAFQNLDKKSQLWLKENREGLPLDTVANIEARCHSLEALLYRINEIIKFTRGHTADDDDSEPDLPSATVTLIARRFDPSAALFAFKSVICISCAFVIASIYYQWGGSLILLLISGFLAPLTVGGLNVMFIDRILGLVVAAVVGLLVFLFVMPNIVQVGELLLVVSVALIPGVVLALKPKTVSMGLSYAMGMLFMLTEAKAAAVSLDPIQERLLSVAGATLICYLVFRIVLPTNAADLVSGRLRKALSSTADLVAISAKIDSDGEKMWQDRKKARHAAIRNLGSFAQLVEDLDSESSASKQMQEQRGKLAEILSSTVICAGTNSVLTSNPRYISETNRCAIMNQALEALGDLQMVIADLLDDAMKYREVEAAGAKADQLISDEQEVVRSSSVHNLQRLDTPERASARLILTEYAYHRALRYFQQRLYRQIQVYHSLAEKAHPEVVGRTA